MSNDSSSVVIVEAVRTPVGRRGGGLSTMHPADLLAQVQPEVVARRGRPGRDRPGRRRLREPGRRAVVQHHPHRMARRRAPPVHGGHHRRHAVRLQPAGHEPRLSLVGAGVVDAAVACGVEVMSRIPIGINSSKKLGLGVPIPKTYFGRYEMTSQFEGAERIADKWGISREDTDAFGLVASSGPPGRGRRAASTASASRVEAPDLDEDGKPTGRRTRVGRDEGIRETTLERLADLKPVAREDGVHTAGTSSQISDGAAAVLHHDRGEGRGARAHPGRGSSTPASSASTRC